MEITELPRNEVGQAAKVLARAFQDDAGLAYIFPDPNERALLAPDLFMPSVRYAMLHGMAYTTEGVRTGVALWLAPGETRPSDDDMAAAGSVEALAGWEPEPLRRLSTLASHLEQVHAEVVPAPHWRLYFLGVDPAHQRHGIGSALIEAAAGTLAGNTCYLETLDAANVPFYERHGFRVVRESQVPDTEIHVWSMLRDSA